MQLGWKRISHYSSCVVCAQALSSSYSSSYSSSPSSSFSSSSSSSSSSSRLWLEQGSCGRQEDLFLLWNGGVHGSRGRESQGPRHHGRLVVFWRAHGESRMGAMATMHCDVCVVQSMKCCVVIGVASPPHPLTPSPLHTLTPTHPHPYTLPHSMRC